MFSPDVVASYSPENSKPLTQLTPGSDFKATWICEKGHKFLARVNKRVQGQNCPVCSGKQVAQGFNDLATTAPKIAEQWDNQKNLPLTPQTITAGSGKKVWWLCGKGHEWEAVVHMRTAGSNCPYSGRKPTPGVNDLATTHPELAAQWHPTKNIYNVTEVSAGSRKKVWWLCEKEHEWETLLHSRGILNTKCPYCAGRKADKENNLTVTHPQLTQQWSDKNVTSPEFHTYGESTKTWWVCDKGHEWETQIKTRTENKNCPICATTQFSSSQEQEIVQFLSQLHISTIKNTRQIIHPYELDIYLPEQNIAIEFNGLYWHSEEHKPKTYHYDKWIACKEQGIQLIQIWEDDWKSNPELIKQMLQHKLGITQQQKIYARECKIVPLSTEQSIKFFTQNHIQGPGKGTLKYGLMFNGQLMAAVIASVKGNTIEIVRYASSEYVVGGFSKLLSHVVKTHKPEIVITFSDNTVSDGGLYETTGFTAVKNLKPDYMYIVNGVRKHKFGYRLHKFKTDPGLTYFDGLTEQKLAALNNISRIWDAGKIKWEKRM